LRPIGNRKNRQAFAQAAVQRCRVEAVGVSKAVMNELIDSKEA
jgi:hypothetical protein